MKSKTNENSVIFIGAGPGDPDLITVKGQKALQQADFVIYAGSLVPDSLLVWAKNAEAVNSAYLSLGEIIDLIQKAVNDGKKVVRLHTGDPSLYGAIYEQMAELDKRDISYTVIPGVTAAFAAAASMKIEYTLPEISQTLILTRITGRTKVPESERLDKLVAHNSSMAIYLSIGQIEAVQKILSDQYGDSFICVIAVKVSQPEEKLFYIKVKDLTDTVQNESIKSQALIIVSPSFQSLQKEIKYKSKLYDKAFKHEYRA
ncbi:MAG: precorrin-4 C11-methyltransferase [Candidatus Magnetoglobus multicellularis str. Araruama]|uniref:Precorrin-4 C11-methyltransferase n=1 Tax=Candidatus Magnetoglobus multicellularis str. Araruama TaxID=890399 RepID=A0A1V1P2W8_9BACT|nr:MAG: precorrin-4 C11-methyltransferase [Candidatus Magnetoglobus multicellularis str. Araruama]